MARLDILVHSFGSRDFDRPDFIKNLDILSDQSRNVLGIDRIYLYIIFGAVPDNVCKLGNETNDFIEKLSASGNINNIHVMMPYGGLEEIFGHLMINYLFNLINRETRDIILSIDEDCSADALDFVNMIVRANTTRISSCIREEYTINEVKYNKISSMCIVSEIVTNHVTNYPSSFGREQYFKIYPNSGGSSILYYVAYNQHAIVKEKVIYAK